MMKMKRWLLCLILLIVSVSLPAEKLATLEGVFKPFTLAVDNQQFYVTEGVTISIYSLKDFSLVKKFGKAGEGPQEFKQAPFDIPMVMVYPQTDTLVINSIGKISVYSKDGTFIKELKSPASGQQMGMFQPIGNQFVGMGMNFGASGNQSLSITINLYDAGLQKVKEIASIPFIQRGRMEFPIVNPVFYVSDNKIIYGGQQEFKVNILAADGNKVASISRDYKPLKVTENYKKGIHQMFKTMLKAAYENIKNTITFADEFPPIQMIYVDNGTIYIQTYMQEGGKSEFFSYDLKGKFLKRQLIPFVYLNGAQPCPTYIKNNKLYQLIENEDEETWELHAEKINM
jgi:hypothetical protein